MEKLSLDEFLNYKFLSGLRLSPDGSHAAFLVRRADREENSYLSDLWVIDTETGGCRRMTSSGKEGAPFWLDGNTLLFPSGREKKENRPGEAATTFYTLRLDGGEAEKAFTVPLAVSGVRPLPDGRYLLCATYDPKAPGYDHMEEAEAERAAKVRKEEQDYTVLDEVPYWSNGEGFVNRLRSRLYTFTPASGELVPLTGERFAVAAWELDESGSRLVYAGAEYSDVCTDKSGVWLYGLASGETTQLAPADYYIEQVCFLNGRVLFLGSDGKDYGMNENYRAYWADTAGVTELARMGLSSWNSVGSDCRLGGGRTFLSEGGAAWLLATDRFCSRIRRLAPDGKLEFVSRAEGSVDCFDVRNGKCLFVGMRGQGLQELYSLDPATGEEKRLTSLNGEALAGKYVAEPQYLPFTDGDGVEIDGWVLLPRDYDPSGRYPAILDIHGGPKTVYGTVYYHEMQYWANEGYFVFFCNPRGGDGRGDEFADLRGKYGTIDYDDLMQFTDVVLAAYPAIDPARLGVTGGSYGGFMTNWIIGHTGRFAAAASQRSIANWVSMSYTTDIGYSFGPEQVNGSAWDGVERMWEQSPLKYADKCTTPTLFIHSDEDYRCWMAEGLQMFTALKLHGVEARLCLFHGENHELSRSGKPRRRIRRLEEITAWMSRLKE